VIAKFDERRGNAVAKPPGTTITLKLLIAKRFMIIYRV
jgi:hypothetical protein